jgi:hypothetical protein
MSSKERRATFGTQKNAKATETTAIERKINPTLDPRSAYGASSRYGSENETANLHIKYKSSSSWIGRALSYCTAILRTDAVLYVMSRMEVLGFSALRICAVGAQPIEYPNVDTTIMAIMPALILSEGFTPVPRPPMARQEAI